VPELNEEEKKEQLRREQRAKLELWNELRIVCEWTAGLASIRFACGIALVLSLTRYLAAISRTLTSLYALVLLTLQTSVQLNVLGRRAYLDSVSALYPRAAPSAPSDGPHQIRLEPGGAGTGADGWGRLDEEEEEKERKETEQLFLTFSWWFLHRGWEEIAALVRESVGEVFGS
jgi:peroxin-3